MSAACRTEQATASRSTRPLRWPLTILVMTKSLPLSSAMRRQANVRCHHRTCQRKAHFPVRLGIGRTRREAKDPGHQASANSAPGGRHRARWQCGCGCLSRLRSVWRWVQCCCGNRRRPGSSEFVKPAVSGQVLEKSEASGSETFRINAGAADGKPCMADACHRSSVGDRALDERGQQGPEGLEQRSVMERTLVLNKIVRAALRVYAHVDAPQSRRLDAPRAG